MRVAACLRHAAVPHGGTAPPFRQTPPEGAVGKSLRCGAGVALHPYACVCAHGAHSCGSRSDPPMVWSAVPFGPTTAVVHGTTAYVCVHRGVHTHAELGPSTAASAAGAMVPLVSEGARAASCGSGCSVCPLYTLYDPRVLKQPLPPSPGLRPGLAGKPPGTRSGLRAAQLGFLAAFAGRVGRPLPRALERPSGRDSRAPLGRRSLAASGGPLCVPEERSWSPSRQRGHG